MTSPVPTPVAAVLGLVPTVLDGVRSLPMRAVQLPIFAVSSVLTGLDRTRRGYDELAERGERLIASLRGASFDEFEDRVEDALEGTRLAAPYERAEDALEDVADTVTAFARSPKAAVERATRSARSSAGKGLEAAADSVDELAERAGRTTDRTPEPEPDQASKGRPTPKATEPDSTRIATAASSDVVETVEKVSAVVGGAVLDHDELPLPDYDHLTLGALRGRMRSLDLPQLVQLRDYEQAKAHRLPVITMLDNRIAKLASDPTAPLSGGSVSGPSDKAASPKSPTKGDKTGASKVTPATAATTSTAPGVAHGGLGGDAPNRG